MNNDLISREALKKAIAEWKYRGFYDKLIEVIDNVPTALFPLTIQIVDKVTDEDIETLKQLMADDKPQVLNLETERPQGEWQVSDIPESTLCKCSICNFNLGAYSFNFCPQCGADMRKGGAEE